MTLLVVIFCSRNVSLASITAAVSYPIYTFLYFRFFDQEYGHPWLNTLFAAVLAALVIYMHRANIQRLRNGTEYRFGDKKKN